MQGWIRDTSDLVRDRTAALAADKPVTIDFGPATAVNGSVGAWPPELMQIYSRVAILGGVHKLAEEGSSEEEEEEEQQGRAGRFGGAYTEDAMLPGAEYVGQFRNVSYSLSHRPRDSLNPHFLTLQTTETAG